MDIPRTTLWRSFLMCYIFFFTDTPTTEIYTLSLHDALPIFDAVASGDVAALEADLRVLGMQGSVSAGRMVSGDRKSTRLNSSHANISYAVFCLKKKKRELKPAPRTTVRQHRQQPSTQPGQTA